MAHQLSTMSCSGQFDGPRHEHQRSQQGARGGQYQVTDTGWCQGGMPVVSDLYLSVVNDQKRVNLCVG